jgi:hypothetical protein
MLIVDLLTMLIFAAGTRLLREKQVLGDPAGACAEEAPGPPAESEVPFAAINRYV